MHYKHNKTKHCWAVVAGGSCPFGDRCHFHHDPTDEEKQSVIGHPRYKAEPYQTWWLLHVPVDSAIVAASITFSPKRKSTLQEGDGCQRSITKRSPAGRWLPEVHVHSAIVATSVMISLRRKSSLSLATIATKRRLTDVPVDSAIAAASVTFSPWRKSSRTGGRWLTEIPVDSAIGATSVMLSSKWKW
ncbi:hypothetical protein EJ110_NYTH43628 [Nymphaea thermarum]|nr:hypothetical protein EJ110_NYTH43628 [Nymphaea thermarum]